MLEAVIKIAGLTLWRPAGKGLTCEPLTSRSKTLTGLPGIDWFGTAEKVKASDWSSAANKPILHLCTGQVEVVVPAFRDETVNPPTCGSEVAAYEAPSGSEHVQTYGSVCLRPLCACLLL